MNKKIIIINLNSSWNIFNFRLELIKLLQSKGYEIIAMSPRDDYVDHLKAAGLKCYNICMNQKGTNPITDFFLFLHYLRLSYKIKPNLILSYTIKPNIYGNFAARILNIPTINNVSGLGTLFIKKSIATYFGKLLYKFSLNSSNHVFFQNNDDRVLFVKNKLVKKNISSVIPGSGVDVKKFNFVRTHNKANKFLFVGRLIADKGVFEYLNAAVSVLKKYPKKEFLLVGELGCNNKSALSSTQIRGYIEKYPQIKYLGKTDNIFNLLESVDVMTLPSYREGLSKSLIEAASMSLPIITTDVPGCKDVVKDGFNGFLCSVKSKSSLEKAIYKMIDLNENERLEFGANGRKIVVNKFSSEIVNKIYISKINEIFNSNN